MEEALYGLAVFIGAVFGFAAFVRSLDQGAKIETLEQQIEGLRLALARKAAAPPVADPAMPPLEPVRADPPPEKIKLALIAAIAAPEPEAGYKFHKESPPPASVRTKTTRMESRLSGNLLIWVGGAALAFGGAFLLKAAIDAGFFGPAMRIAAALLAGGAMIAGGEWARRTQAREISATSASAAWRRSIAPAVLAGAGGATLYATVYAAFALFDMMPATVALFLLAAASAALVSLAVVHGAPALAQMGLAGAFVSPLLAGGDTDGPGALLAYVFAVSAAGLFLMRKMGWRVAGLIALAGGLGWPALWIAGDGDLTLAVALYLPAFIALAAAAAWKDAATDIDLREALTRGVSARPVTMAVFHLALFGAVALSALAALRDPAASLTAPMWGAIALLTLGIASRRDGFALAPLVTLAGLLVATALSDDGARLSSPVNNFALAGLFGAGGHLAMRGREKKAALASAAAIGPIALFSVQFWRDASVLPELAWSLTALALAAVNIALLALLRRRGGSIAAHPGAVSAFVVGASLATSVAIVAAFDGLFLSAALALQTPVMALLWKRYRLDVLKFASIAIAIAASLRLLLLPEIVTYAFGAAPVFNLLIAGYIIPAAGFWVAARVFERGGVPAAARVIQSLEGAAIALFAAFVTLEIRHWLNDGNIAAPTLSFLEISLQIVNWMSVAAFLRWRFGKDLTPVRQAGELILTGVSLAAALTGPLLRFNPMRGAEAALVSGPPVLNTLLIFYLAPALAFAAAAFAARRSGALMQSRLTAVAAAVMGLVWLSLTIRQAFHAPDLSRGGADLAEFSLNIIAWLSIAAALRWRYRAKGAPVIRAAENLLAGAAGALFAGASLALYNPWWGAGDDQIAGPPILNMTLVHFAAPALALAFCAYAARASGALTRARAFGLASALTGLVFLIMEVRQAFHAPDLARGAVTVAEGWCYSAAMTLYAAALLIAGALRRSDIFRRAGFAILVLAIGKVFILDLSALDGLWRATAFLGLGAALVGIAVLYQRLNRTPA